MRELVLKMVVAGVLFGAWPLFMNRSGLNGPASIVVLNVIVLLFALPAAWYGGATLAGANWWLAITAGCCSGLGYLAFNSGVVKATPQTVGQLVVLMIVVQMAVPAAYQAAMTGHLALKSGFGFAAAAVAAILLV